MTTDNPSAKSETLPHVFFFSIKCCELYMLLLFEDGHCALLLVVTTAATVF